jgi:hypothetical protein
MSLRRLPWFALLLVPLAGCGPKPTAAPTALVEPVIAAPFAPESRKVSIKPVPMTADDWKAALPRSYDEPLRGGKTNEGLARELEREAFAFEFSGGSFDWWFEVEEVGQDTLQRKRVGEKDWRVEATAGRLVVSVGRAASERMKKVMQAAGKDAFPESVSFDLQVAMSMGGTFGHSFDQNPLWYGWAGNKDVKSTPATIDAARVGDTVTVLTLTCEEPMPADKAKPKKVTVSLKAKFVSAADPKPEGK